MIGMGLVNMRKILKNTLKTNGCSLIWGAHITVIPMPKAVE
jgi:hypothetical protein